MCPNNPNYVFVGSNDGIYFIYYNVTTSIYEIYDFVYFNTNRIPFTTNCTSIACSDTLSSEDGTICIFTCYGSNVIIYQYFNPLTPETGSTTAPKTGTKITTIPLYSATNVPANNLTTIQCSPNAAYTITCDESNNVWSSYNVYEFKFTNFPILNSSNAAVAGDSTNCITFSSDYSQVYALFAGFLYIADYNLTNGEIGAWSQAPYNSSFNLQSGYPTGITNTYYYCSVYNYYNMYINEIDSNSYFLDWDSSNNTQLIGITSIVTSSEVYNTYALDCSLNVYEIYVSTPNDPPTTLYYVGDTSWSEGSIICTFTGLNKKPVTEFTTIEGELELQKLLLGDYIDDTIIKTFKKLRTKNYIRVYNITDKIQNTLSEFLTNTTYTKLVIKSINELTELFLQNKITLDEYNVLLKKVTKDLSEQYGELYVFNYLKIQESIKENKHILENKN
jgi:hypothetical protein